MWLTVRQLHIKSAWWDAFLALRDFSRNNKHSIRLSTTKTLYFSRFVFAMSAFHQSRFPILICNKSAAETWICLVFSHGSHSSWDFLFYYVIKCQLKHMFSFKSSHRRCSVKKVFLKISQISQENTCVGVSS